MWEIQPIDEFWRDQFGKGEPDFTEWLFGSERRKPLGHPARLRFDIENTIDTYLWDVDSEVQHGGDFRIDGTARGFHQGEYVDVVLEAQFGTDRTTSFEHLGKLLVYARLGKADVVVWITPRRLAKARQFLRSISYVDKNSALDFYHIYIHVTEIDDIQPHDPTIELNTVPMGPETTNQVEADFVESQQRKFWLMLEESAGQMSLGPSRPKARPVHPCGHAVSTSGIKPAFEIDAEYKQIKFRASFEGQAAEERYRALKKESGTLKSKIWGDISINWSQDGTLAIEIAHSGFEIEEQHLWDGYIRWLLGTLSNFREMV